MSIALPCGEAVAQWDPPGSEELVPALPKGPDRVTKRYGVQILLVDAAAIGAAIGTEEGAVLLGGYLLGGPLVHVANGNPKTAFTSLALRAGLPLGGILIGAAAAESDCADSEEMFCGLGHVAVGAFVGMLTASVLDAAVLAKKTETVEGAGRPSLIKVRGVAANPDLRVTRAGSVTFGLAGSF